MVRMGDVSISEAEELLEAAGGAGRAGLSKLGRFGAPSSCPELSLRAQCAVIGRIRPENTRQGLANLPRQPSRDRSPTGFLESRLTYDRARANQPPPSDESAAGGWRFKLNVKYQIFVSSTYVDLREERNEVIKACLNMGHIPVGMEMFNAADEEQWQVITRTIDQCDYYVVIVAHRYGSTTPDGMSFTEKEYDYARAQGIPILGFIIDDGAAWPRDLMETDHENQAKLDRFKAKVKGKMVRFWNNGPQLQAQFVTSLGTTINLKPSRGWVRAPEGGADVAQTISNLAEENASLRQELQELRAAQPIRDEVENALQALDRIGFDGRRFLFIVNHSNEVGVEMQAERENLCRLGLLKRTGAFAYGITPLGSRVYTRVLLDEPPF